MILLLMLLALFIMLLAMNHYYSFREGMKSRLRFMGFIMVGMFIFWTIVGYRGISDFKLMLKTISNTDRAQIGLVKIVGVGENFHTAPFSIFASLVRSYSYGGLETGSIRINVEEIHKDLFGNNSSFNSLSFSNESKSLMLGDIKFDVFEVTVDTFVVKRLN